MLSINKDNLMINLYGKVIYLNSLFKEQKPNKKAIELINKAIIEANGINRKAHPRKKYECTEVYPKEYRRVSYYAVDYSMNDEMGDDFYYDNLD